MALGAMVLALPTLVVAQPSSNADSTRLNRRLKMLLTTPDNISGLRGIRFSNVSIYKLSDELTSKLRRFLSKDDKGDSDQVCAIVSGWLDDELPCPEIFGAVNAAVGPRDPRRFGQQIRQQLAVRLGLVDADDVPEEDFNSIMATFQSLKNRAGQRPNEFYLVTSRATTKPRLIGLLGFKNAEGNLTLAGQQFVWAGNDLYGWLASNQEYSGMYSDMTDAIVEGNTQVLQNVTYQIRDVDGVEFTKRSKARATYIDEGTHDWVLTGISDGRPLRAKADTATTPSEMTFDFGALDNGGGNPFARAVVPGTGEYPYELALGSDILASFRAYELQNGNEPLPKWGIEVRNNFDEINYPSIWGGRVTASAVLENIRIGAVLPTFRFGESIATSGFGESQQKIIGGYGAAMSGDFAFPLLDNSGLFSFYTSYTFSEAQTETIVAQSDSFAVGPTQEPAYFLNDKSGESGYLVRYAAIGYYSFGFFADKDANHMFRIKIGGGSYGVDTYKRMLDTADPEAFVAALNMSDSGAAHDTLRTLYRSSTSVESRGGVGARIEYMRGGTKYPFGAALHYFDGSLLGNIWLQFAIGQQLDLKLEGKYFTSIFRSPRLWENENLVVPSVTVKYHFGTPPVEAGGF